MASADWTALSSGLSAGSAPRGVTAGTVPPNGGGTFTYGIRSETNEGGSVGFYCNLSNFSPMAKGGIITGALLKNAGDCAGFFFIGLQGTGIASEGYLLGFSQEDPPHLILRKGAPSVGLPDEAVGVSGVLARSTNTFVVGEWVHLKLEMVANPSGDVVLNVYQSNLDDHAVTSPSWEAIDGMRDAPGGIEGTAFIDDAIGENSGSVPFTSGRAGFGGRFDDVNRVVHFDHVTIARQT